MHTYIVTLEVARKKAVKVRAWSRGDAASMAINQELKLGKTDEVHAISVAPYGLQEK